MMKISLNIFFYYAIREYSKILHQDSAKTQTVFFSTHRETGLGWKIKVPGITVSSGKKHSPTAYQYKKERAMRNGIIFSFELIFLKVIKYMRLSLFSFIGDKTSSQFLHT